MEQVKVKPRSWVVLAGWLAASLSAGAIGGVATSSSVSVWYPTLAKPPWTPPPWLFGPVWTLLYVMMAVAAWLVWRTSGGRQRAVALGLFVAQLVLNATWSILFFGMRSPLLGLIDILLLWVLIGAVVVAFFRVAKVAGALMLPYWAWVSFAVALNLAIWRMNA